MSIGIFNSAIFNNQVFNTGDHSTPGRSGLGGDDVPRRNPNKGWNRDEWKRLRKDPQDAIETTLRQAYAELTQDAPLAVLAKVEAIVRPVAKVTQGQPHVINWQQLAGQYERSNALYKLWQEEQDLRAAIDEEDELLMMLI